MISCVCPGCGGKFSAKDRLAGRTMKCPACGNPLQVPALAASPAAPVPGPIGPEAAEPHVHEVEAAPLPPLGHPTRLDRRCRYLVCDDARLVAVWQNDGRGWMLATDFGLISATLNPERLPSQGDFKLIELSLKMIDASLRIENLVVYQLADRWALTNLDRSDDQVLTAVTGRAALTRPQKDAVRNAIHHQFMHEVWEKSTRVMEYLANTDYHSHGTT
jgi:hypothetical protein